MSVGNSGLPNIVLVKVAYCEFDTDEGDHTSADRPSHNLGMQAVTKRPNLYKHYVSSSGLFNGSTS